MTVAVDRRIGNQRPRLWQLPVGRGETSAAGEAIALANSCGLYLDDWEDWCVRGILSEDPMYRICAAICLVIVPRQNGKNTILEVLELAGLFLFDLHRIIHTAHLAKTAIEHQLRMVGLIQANPELDKMCQAYYGGNDRCIVRLDTGARLEFHTRGRKSIRGGSPEWVIFDEALFLTDEQLQAILPSLSAQSLNVDGAPQMFYFSSAPLADSAVLLRVRQAFIDGLILAGFYAEWGCAPGADPTDRENWYLANPGLGIRISEEWIAEQELPILTPEAFAIERLGVVLGADQGQIEIPGWADCRDEQSQMVGNPTALVVDVAPDLSWYTVGVAGLRADGLLHAEIVDRVPEMSDAVKIAAAMGKKYRLDVGLDPRAAASALIPDLLAGGVKVTEFSTTDLIKACAGLKQTVADKRLRHRGQQPLDAAVQGAGVRAIGEGWAWGRRVSTVDISPLMVVTFAVWVASNKQERVDVWVDS